ncbi:putative Tetratricopeptide repeat-like superfamily protein [Hibiscus syriacus]|uniref:Tetratricopeptide repeat-like superfamily protein n=1 Tax=Hibiscus syriacus TaxID=106335 RepID=A0A6A3CVR9_HIBSY|nr:putative Tetratricopeptide repeat-like superfamily protein [Hibiscus syriacus]
MSLLDIPSGVIKSNFFGPRREKEKVVILLGATGTGKSGLSVDLATRFPAEIINSDKIHVHAGLDIATNKIPEEERCGIPHHFLGVMHPNADFTATDFVDMASDAMTSILSRSQVPMIAGGLKFVHRGLSRRRRFPVPIEIRMLRPMRRHSNAGARSILGIRKAIGILEFDPYFRADPFLNKRERNKLLQEAIQEIKKHHLQISSSTIGKDPPQEEEEELEDTHSGRHRSIPPAGQTSRRGVGKARSRS